LQLQEKRSGGIDKLAAFILLTSLEKEECMIRPSKVKRSVPWIVAAGFLLAVGGILYTLSNQELEDTFSHIPQPDVVETQVMIAAAAPVPTPTPELEGIRIAADPEIVPVLASVEEEEAEEPHEPEAVEEEPVPAHTAYRVQSGDTLGDIALQHNLRVRDLLESNDGIEHPNRIYAGQELSVPEPRDTPVIGLFSGIIDEPRPYTVQKGETLSLIAARRGFTLEAVLEANPEISDPNHVRVGDVIVIPPHPANIMPDFHQAEINGSYVVQEGDTLSMIALNHGTSVDRMLEVNEQLEDPNLIFSGQVVAVPEPGEIIPMTGRVDEGYVVQPGETLGEIALRHGVTVDEIAAVNDIDNPNLILAGQVLVIPEPSQRTAAETEPKEGRHYIVRQGDTLGEIALLHRKTVAELVEANNIDNPNRIVPGQVIIIPEA
jgi:LysM repeat protein